MASCNNTDSSISQWKDLENDHNKFSLSLKPSSNLELLVNKFNNATQKNGNDSEIIVSFKYNELMKCITLKHLIKINHYPYSI